MNVPRPLTPLVRFLAGVSYLPGGALFLPRNPRLRPVETVPPDPEGCAVNGVNSVTAADDSGCTQAPIDKTCPGEIIGVHCGDEPIHPDPSMIPIVCANVSTFRTQEIDVRLFRQGHPLDFKRTRAGGNERLGNVNYGAVMRAWGFPEGLILRGGGAYQWAQDLSNSGTIYPPLSKGPFLGAPWGNSPFGDDDSDQLQISQDIGLVDSGACN